MKKYNLIISLGEDCACASHLKKYNLRVNSYPFDWLTAPPFEARIDMILNDFKDFLNIDDITNIDDIKINVNIPHDNENIYYKNSKNGFYFFHDFKKDVPFNESFLVVKEKYDRRIKRLYEMVETSQKVLFVWFAPAQKVEENLIINLNMQIKAKFNKNIDFLIIENNEESGEFICKQLSDSITKYSFKISADDKKGAHHAKSQCRKIFKSYSLIEPFHVKFLRRAKRPSVKFLSAFLPTRSLRRKLRNFLK